MLSTDAARRLEGLVFDVDDTLTRHGKLEPEAYQALWDAHRAGLRLILVTGRPLGWCEVMALQWPVDAAVGENGAGWLWSKRAGEATAGYWEPSPVRRDQQRRHLARLVDDARDRMPWARLASDQWARRCDVAFDLHERVDLTNEQEQTLVAHIEAHGARALVSSVHAHALLADCDKAKGLARAAADALDIDVGTHRDRWLFVGDSPNDASCFTYFPLSAAVANVRAHLAALASKPHYVAQEDCGRGFAEIVATVLTARGS